MNIQVRAANPTTQMAAALAEQTVKVSSRPTARTTPTGAESGINIEVPSGALHVSGAVGIAEGADAVDAVGAVVTKPKALEALDVIDAALRKASEVVEVVSALRADPTYNGAGQLPVLMEWHISLAFKASGLLREHANGNTQAAPVLDFALSALEYIGDVVIEAFKWAADFVKIAGATALGTALVVWTPQQWHDAAVTLSKTLESLRAFF